MERRRLRLAASRLLAAVVPILLLCGCDPYAEVKAELSPDQVARFERGQRVATPCWTCHDLRGGAHKVGPALVGLFGRPAGSAEGFAYSDAIRSSGFIWSVSTLDAFLRDGQGTIPGNRMVSPGEPDPGRRSDLIFFLERVTAAR